MGPNGATFAFFEHLHTSVHGRGEQGRPALPGMEVACGSSGVRHLYTAADQPRRRLIAACSRSEAPVGHPDRGKNRRVC
jgi:hypothetical protein